MLCRATQDGQVMVESSDKRWSTGGNGKPLQYTCFENPLNSMKRQRYYTERWTPQADKCPIGYWGRVEKKLRKNKETEPKQKNSAQLWMWLVMEVKSDAVRTILQYCIGTRNVRSISSVQSLSRVQLLATPWIAARQASLSIASSTFNLY